MDRVQILYHRSLYRLRQTVKPPLQPTTYVLRPGNALDLANRQNSASTPLSTAVKRRLVSKPGQINHLGILRLLKIIKTLALLFSRIDLHLHGDEKIHILDHQIDPSLLVDHIFFDDDGMGQQGIWHSLFL